MRPLPDALLRSLIEAQSEDEVAAIVAEHPILGNEANWQPYGGPERAGIFFNQPSSPVAALADKIVNCIDARLMRECLARGIGPEGPQAPPTMGDAVERFFGIKAGELVETSERRRRELAEGIVLAADGSTRQPNLLIIDTGEGQLPDAFPDTFLSLERGNKQRIWFVQGQFNMGGIGVLPFAGERGYQLIASRRAPELCDGERGWGFTLLRHHAARPGEKSSYWEYCTDGDGAILEASGSPLDVLPSGSLESGTIVKLWNYDLPAGLRTNITLDLWRELNRKLWAPALPLLMWEKRSYRGHSATKPLLGNGVRVQLDARDWLEPGTPLAIYATLGPLGLRRVEVSVFKMGYRKSDFASPDEAIILTVNGQAQASLGRSFLKAPTRANLGYLGDYMLVHIDCTDVPVSVRERIFQPSRDRMFEGSQRRQIEDGLAEALAGHEGLRQLDDARRVQELAEKTSDERVTQLIGRLLKENKRLRDFLVGGGRFVTPEEPGDVEIKKFVGRRIPTFLRFRGQGTHDQWKKQIPVGSFARMTLETDAPDDYFDRRVDRGQLLFDDGLVKNYHLYSGRLALKVAPPPGAQPGDRLSLRLVMTRAGESPLEVDALVEVVKPAVRDVNGGGGGSHSDPSPRGADVGAPKLWLVYKEAHDGCKRWEEMDPPWTKDDVCEVRGQARDVFVNMDSGILHDFLRRRRRMSASLRDQIHEAWKLSLYFYGLALSQDLAKYEDFEAVFKDAIGALSKVILEAFYSQLLIDAKAA